jgi:hypothetical protein
MATLHKEYNSFNGVIKLTESRKSTLRTSRKDIKKKIRDWFSENKPDELQPKFSGQGSFDTDTIVNPIPEKDENDKTVLKYDLDYGVYFVEKEDENNRQEIITWHNWVYESVEDHTNIPPVKKNTCVRVIFADGHHIDLPIYYRDGDVIELAHKRDGWRKSDPKEFKEWFENSTNGKPQLCRIVRYIKAWKNYRENKNTSLKLATGFELTILAVQNYISDDKDDISFRKTVKAIYEKLTIDFCCKRPTTPKNEDLFEEYSETRKNNFLNTLKSLVDDCEKADEEKNFKRASEYLRDNQFGDRFPLGKDETEEEKSNSLASSIASTGITHRPYYDR